MKKIKVSKLFSLRAACAVAATLCLAVASFAQVKLRNVLDYDGDSKADLAVFRQSDNTWYILKSSGSGSLTQAFGSLHTDTLAPGDYDGDNKADIGVWRYSNATFYYLTQVAS